MKIKPNFAKHFEEFSKVESEVFSDELRTLICADVTATLNEEADEEDLVSPNSLMDSLVDAAVARGYACGLYAGAQAQKDLAQILFSTLEAFQNYTLENFPETITKRIELLGNLGAIQGALEDFQERRTLLESE